MTMTDTLPPIANGAVRIIVQDATEGRMVAEFPAKHLPELLDFSCITGPMPPRTVEGSLKAVSLYGEAMQREEELIACGVALWICVHGGDMPAMVGGLTFGDLRAAAEEGNGAIVVRMTPDGRDWEYLLSSDSGRQVGGRVRIDVPAWSKGPMGSA